MAISKRLRFEILRRDAFTCRYCGSGANLTVDHVVPTALGGSDEPENLTTACADCNSGKSATPPDAPLVADVAQDALRWSRAMQRAVESMAAEAARVEEDGDAFADLWMTHMPSFCDLPVDFDTTVERLRVAGLSKDEILGAVKIAAGANHVPRRKRFNYFAGICWNKVAELQRRAAAILEADADGT